MKKGWKQVTLEDLIHIKHGYGFKGEFFVDEPSEYILVTPGNFAIGGGFKTNKLKYYDGELKEEFILKGGDVIVTMTDLSKQADTLGFSAKVPDDGKTYLHNQRIGLVSLLSEDVTLDFIYWLLRTESYQKYVAGSSTGATVKHTSPSKIYSTKLSIPSCKIKQQKIADILSAYDDLIENNTKRIELLEEQSQLIYEEWFLRMKFPDHEHAAINSKTGLPEGWSYKQLNEIADLIKTSIHPDSISSDTPYIGLEHIPRKSITLSKWETSQKVDSLKYQYQKGDVLFGKIRPYFHKVGVALNSGVTSTDTIVLRAKSLLMQGLLLNVVFSNHFVDSATQSSNGTKMPRANWAVLKKYPVIVPSEEVIEQYDDIFKSIIKGLETLVSQNVLLKEAQDILLPRLMLGIIEV